MSCYDAHSRRDFILHAHIITWTGDILALTKIMNIKGHNSYLGCRFCNIKEVYSEKHKHIYFHPQKKESHKRNHAEWLLQVIKIEESREGREKEELIQKYGKNYY